MNTSRCYRKPPVRLSVIHRVILDLSTYSNCELLNAARPPRVEAAQSPRRGTPVTVNYEINRK